jgi:hypothetical protein
VISRKGFLAASAAGVAGIAYPALGRAAVRAATKPTGYATYLSEPSLKPPTLTVDTLTTPAPGYVFVTTLTGPGQRGPMIVDNHGQVVWFRRVRSVAINFRRQVYRGKPVLTWWEGEVTKIGTSEGENKIVDSSYKTIARVDAGNGYKADVHEFLLTPKGTALITVHAETQVDLTPVGGPAKGNALDSIVQEIDVASGKVLFEWHSLDHVPLTETYSPLLDPFDYFHVNSIDVDYDGNLIISAKNTAAVYKLDRKTGAVVWRLGGRKSDFQVAPEAGFFYQHDARVHPDGTLTVFDDGTGDPSHPARGLRLRLDQQAKTCSLVAAYPHPTPLVVTSMGNAQVVPGGGMMIGFGDQPYVTEFGPKGDVRFDAKFDGDAWNYRAFRDVWVGRPATRPVLAVRRSGRAALLDVSWNGSTETAYWRVDAGPTASALRHVKTVPRQGFETTIRLGAVPVAVAVTALDRGKRALGVSKLYRPFV